MKDSEGKKKLFQALIIFGTYTWPMPITVNVT